MSINLFAKSLHPIMVLCCASLCAAWILLPQKANATERQITVELFASRSPIQSLTLDPPFTIENHPLPPPNGAPCVLSASHGVLVATRKSPLQIGRRALINGGTRGVVVRLPDGTRRRYRGLLLVTPSSNDTLLVKNKVNYEDYVASVIGSESLPDTPVEALKAQSVLIQTLMLRYRPGDELNDTTQTQAYSGADFARPIAVRAFAETRGQKLQCKESPVQVYFHAACAGATSSSELFAGKPPNLACDRGVQCDFCKDSPFWQKKKARIPKSVFLKHFPSGVPSIVALDSAHRPLRVRFPNGRTTYGYDFWLKAGQRLGWDKMPGTRFEVADKGDFVELSSNGAGHGIGLCQSGARGMAASGLGYQAILQHYFPGAVLITP